MQKRVKEITGYYIEINDIRTYYEIDTKHRRFLYDPHGFPLRKAKKETQYESSYLKQIETELSKRTFRTGYGTEKDNTWNFMSSICQHSYLLSHKFIPSRYAL